MPFHPNGADVTLSNSAASATQENRNLEGDLAEEIGGKKVVRTSQVCAENRPGRTFVVAVGIHGPKIRGLEFRVMGVAQIAIDIPRASQCACKPKPRSLGIGAGEEARSWRSEFFVGRDYRRMAKLIAQLNPRAQGPI